MSIMSSSPAAAAAVVAVSPSRRVRHVIRSPVCTCVVRPYKANNATHTARTAAHTVYASLQICTACYAGYRIEWGGVIAIGVGTAGGRGVGVWGGSNC